MDELKINFDDDCIVFDGCGSDIPGSALEWLRVPERFVNSEQVSFLSQIVDDNYAKTQGHKVLLRWEELYNIINSQEYPDAAALIGLPSKANLRMALAARGSMADPQLEISLEWRDAANRRLDSSVCRCGGRVTVAGEESLLDVHCWRLAEEVRRFSRRSKDNRSQRAQEQAWAKLRQMAKRANADLDHFLERTVILTVDKLCLRLRRTEFHETSVVEVVPSIEAAPDLSWLNAFDNYTTVQDYYDLATPEGGLIRVMIEPDTKFVLAEIKRMPGRRLTGERAEAFLRNPYALLGDAMSSVVPPEEFEKAREEARIVFYDFRCEARRDDQRIRAIQVAIMPRTAEKPVLPGLELSDRASAKAFADSLEKAITSNAACFRWNGKVLELNGGDSIDQLRQVRAWLCAAWSGEQVVTWERLIDLSQYAERVEAIGAHQPQYVPYLVKRDEQGGWLPENLEEVVVYTAPNGEKVIAPTGAGYLPELKRWLADDPHPTDTFTPTGWPAPIAPAEARRLLEVIQQAKSQPPSPPSAQEGQTTPPPHSEQSAWATIVIKQNVLQVDYSEERGICLKLPDDYESEAPGYLLPGARLKAHQEKGLALLQHLWGLRQSRGVRGAMLADDMGLGKTLQLLAFIAWYLEKTGETSLPVLIVAPVSLLDNWQREINTFFDQRLAGEIISLYGESLRQRKSSRQEIASVAEHGIRGLLRPDWRGAKKIVLTTYETMRDLEISLARESWSIMVCDEAQKIKTPGALMTHAAKAQNALFRIACTGTPVENSLADLWCLFDFIQPGLLGSLAEFCRTYRRPIETKTEEEKAQLERLRSLIEPQTLRRMKDEVADLPPRHIRDDCKMLNLSPYQYELYRQAASENRKQSKQNEEVIPKGNAVVLRLLHRLRSICADPREEGTTPGLNVPLEEHCERSPKMAWLLRQLDEICKKEEKVIIFTEFRDLQRTLQRRIQERFGFSPCIVNGSTSVEQNAGERSRQGLIDSFQDKSGFNAIILSTTAIGFGVNIQKANHVIHFTRAWNPAKEDQATDRAHRIGQTLPVNVYYPTVCADKFDTFEVKLDEILQRKRELARDMLNGAGEITAGEWGGLRAPGGADITIRKRIEAEHLARLEATLFEKLCRLYLEREGYRAHLTSHAGDGGIDVVAIRGGEGLLVQCKSSSREQNLGWEAIKDVKAGYELYKSKSDYQDVIFNLVAATNREFNNNARMRARELSVKLWEASFWEEWLGQESVYVDELDQY